MVAAATGAAITFVLACMVARKWELGVRRVAGPLFGLCAVSAVVAYLAGAQLAGLGWLPTGIVAAVLAGGLALAVLAARFFRDPEREIPDVPGAIISPADGTVAYIRRYREGTYPVSEKLGRSYVLEELADTTLGRGESIVVGIAMDFLDVHVNRAPVAGQIRRRVRRPGRFASLKRPEAIFENERVTTVIATERFELAMVQIASRLVRRIVSFVDDGDTVSAGQRVGVIRLGSQVDLILPADAGVELTVAPGDRLQAGTSVVALPVGTEQHSDSDPRQTPQAVI